MEKITTLNFELSINAPKEKVWSVLWNDKTYRQWTTIFCEGSYAESDWQENSSIRFLSPNGNGMYGCIKKLVPNQEMTFEHHGEISKGEEKEAEWKGALESYTLQEEHGTTRLTVTTDVVESFLPYMQNTFPKALQVVKELAEKIEVPETVV